VAALVKQIAFLQVRDGGVKRDGERWTRQTYDGLVRHVPGVRKTALRYSFGIARDLGLVHTIQERAGQLMRVDLAAVVGLCAEAHVDAPNFATGQGAPSPALRWDLAIEGTTGRNAAGVLYQVHTWTRSLHAVERDGERWAETTIPRLAERLGLSGRTVERAIAACRRAGLLRTVRRPYRLLMRPDYASIVKVCGDAAPTWATVEQPPLPGLVVEADVAQVLDEAPELPAEPAGVLERELLQGMIAEGWIGGPNDPRVRTLRRELAGVDPQDGAEIAAAIVARTREAARTPPAFAVRLVRDYKATERLAPADVEERDGLLLWDERTRERVPVDDLVADTLKRFEDVHGWESIAGAIRTYQKNPAQFYDDVKKWERMRDRQKVQDRKGGNRYF